jgi:PAS domain S-box-containing protein
MNPHLFDELQIRYDKLELHCHELELINAELKESLTHHTHAHEARLSGLIDLTQESQISERRHVDRRQVENELRIAATVFESQVGMIVTDAREVILRVNTVFSEITGYSSQEVVGQTPRVLRSTRHDKSYYSAMWESINRTGIWQGEIWNRRKTGEEYPEFMTSVLNKCIKLVLSHKYRKPYKDMQSTQRCSSWN